MKVKYESDDGMVSGYGDEGKAAVEAHEADPLAWFNFPWEWNEKSGLMTHDGAYVSGERYIKACVLGSLLAPLVQELVKAADETWAPEWRQWSDSERKNLMFAVARMEDAMNEVLNG